VRRPEGRSTVAFGRAAGAAAAGVALVLVAFLFDATPLLVPGTAFAALGIGAPAWVWGLMRAASVSRRLEQERVVEQEPLEAMVEVRGWLPGGEVLDPLAGDPVRLPAARRSAIRVLARFEHRGVRRLEPPSLRLRDPLALAECAWTPAERALDVLVLPRTEPVRWAGRGGEAVGAAAARTRAELLAAVEVDGLRPYRRGTPASRIHWQSLARGAGLLERRLRVDGDQTPLIVLDARGSGPREHLDAAVRAAASLVLELARAGGSRLLLADDRRALAVESDLAAWPTAHARLALVEGGPRARAPAFQAVRSALGLVLYVAARRVDRLDSALGSEGWPGSAAVLVVPAALAPRGRASFSVAGCVGVAVRLGRRQPAREAAA
jgi:uncharacterized protein (DUF58 family)